jgi:DNA recombination protein RmuC
MQDRGLLISNEFLIWVVLVLLVAVVALLLTLVGRQQDSDARLFERNDEQARQFHHLQEQLTRTRVAQLESLADLRSKLEQRFGHVQQSIEQRLGEMSAQQIGKLAASNLQIQETLHKRLNEISGQVEQRLVKGFEKTTETFNNVVERLAKIDEAQKKITELSVSVVSLQEVLTDKRSRGAFGEAQMMMLVRNSLPESSFAEQFSLKNGARVDCMLFLPEPTGNVPIDAKFPLDTFKQMVKPELPELERQLAVRQFRIDIKKHINDIADKYIVPGETADGAIMFLPAEAVFAEIHAYHQELVELAQHRHVWLTSPTTLMAILTTASAVMKDAATREQVHLIQEHLKILGKDFERFSERMAKLAIHIRQANKDVDDIHVSAKKISSRFVKIENVELDEIEQDSDEPATLPSTSGEKQVHYE